jgi:predicted RNase H-like HicB family nuclease
MKDIYTFPAILRPFDGGIALIFPDIPDANVEGDNEEEALGYATDCLSMAIYNLEEANEEIPEPTIPEVLEVNTTDRIISIQIDMRVERPNIEESIRQTHLQFSIKRPR